MQLSPHSSHLVSHLLLVNTSARLHVVAEGNHLSTASWGSWCCESITEANQEDSPGLLAERQFTLRSTVNLAGIEWTGPSLNNGFVE